MTDTVLAFPEPRERTAELSRGTGFALRGTQAVSFSASARRTSTVPAVIEIDKLYPSEVEPGSDIVAALTLLAETIRQLGEARVALQKRDVIAADRLVQHFQVSLPSLFRYRRLGDGYGVIINSLHFAFINLRGHLLTFEQLTTVWRILKELRHGPFIPFEQALAQVAEMEKCGLQPDPAILSELIEDGEEDDDNEK